MTIATYVGKHRAPKPVSYGMRSFDLLYDKAMAESNRYVGKHRKDGS